MLDTQRQKCVPEDRSRLIVLGCERDRTSMSVAIQSIRKDMVVLIRNLSATEAEDMMCGLADGLGLAEELALQASYVNLYRHRYGIGKYFMSVNERTEFQWVPPHSEGSRAQPIQLAAFFCYENTTDGGETILMSVDDSSDAWPSLREKVRKGRLVPSRTLTGPETLRARGQYFLNLPGDLLRDEDEVLGEQETKIPGLSIVDVLTKPERAYSRILNRDSYVYWDSVASIDFDSGAEYERLLRQSGLLRQLPAGLEIEYMDSQAQRRIWRSGVVFSQLFGCKITIKLAPGDLIIQNNFTWTHAATNWSPASGTRRVAACFA